MVDVGGQPIDRYVVLQHLSEGGMGAIYVGKKLGAGGFEMEVVLKQLLPEFTQQEEFIDLFLREAKLSATLDHANIVHTIDLVTAGGEYFIVMEYLPGGDLRTLLKRAKRRGKRFSPAAAIYITREVASALAYAHVKRDWNGTPLQLIHRDVSPSNILVSYAGEVKLTDFGIAKASTHTSQFYKVKGKIGYMSPEQAKSESLDSRSDLYSLAVCLYEIVSGERLFVAAGLTTSAEEIYSQPVPSLAKKIAGLPVELDQIIQRALAIDPARRYQTAGELNEALTRCAHRNGLLMSAPELAQELLVDCGPTEQWRDEDEEDALESHARPGTEIYDVSGDDDDDGDADDDSQREVDSPIAGMLGIQAARSVRTPSGERAKTEVGKFHGVELTSIINLMDIEAAGRGSSAALEVGPARVSVAQMPMQPMPAPPLPRTALASPPPPPLGYVSPGLDIRGENLGPLPAALPRDHRGVAAPRRVAPVAETAVVVDQKKRAAALAAANSGSLAQPSRPSRKKKSLAPVLVVVAVLLAAGIAAVVVALSGPSIAAEKNK